MPSFANRRAAGEALAAFIIQQYPHWLHQPDKIVLGLPRGGIPVAFAVAKGIGAPLDAYIVRKLGVPGQEELAMGALAMDGSYHLDNSLIRWLKIDKAEIDRCLAREQKELARRATLYRGSVASPEITGKKVILVDDGLATGATMRAAVHALKKNLPAALLVAVPVAPPSTIRELEPEVDRIICLEKHEPFVGVGMWYRDFSQTSDQEVQELLTQARELDQSQKDLQAPPRSRHSQTQA